MKIDILYSAARHPWPQLLDRVLQAEADGLGRAWVFDHLCGAMLSGTRMLECFTLAGALAAATSTIGIGTLVVNAANRPAGVTVAAAASVQEISGGRFVFGLGAGAAPGTAWSREHELLDIPLYDSVERRHQHLIDVIDLCDAQWDPDRTDTWAAFPLPSPRPPILLGVNSTGLAKIAGTRCDAMNIALDHPRFEEFIAAARTARAASALADRPFEVTAWTPLRDAALDPDGDAHRRVAEVGGDGLVLVA
ncbi:LLM class flavin-dependent oxidoreductase [Mycobacterium camsae]|uniref:LLM class flavin-dependent oxidoreductase n=1 Tax=Mycobacterium gordonae TaxID=1778 RepID=UPI00198216C3|nr:LLM class flavin-dependent oxidoreductase [Mycobacterium gordonae]